MNPGKLNHRVEFQTLTQTLDASGGLVETWATTFIRWADVRPVRGREPYINDQRQAELDLVVSVRYDAKTKLITAKNRIKYGSRILEIEGPGINVEEENKEIRFFCTERP